MSESDNAYVTLEEIRERVSGFFLNKKVASSSLSGPLRQLKGSRFSKLLSDVESIDGTARIANYTTFSDPSMKAFVRMQNELEHEKLSLLEDDDVDPLIM
jgi:hypothetical protein